MQAALQEFLFHTLSGSPANLAHIENNFNKELMSSLAAGSLLILAQCEIQVDFLLEMKHFFTILLSQSSNTWTGKLFGCNVRFFFLNAFPRNFSIACSGNCLPKNIYKNAKAVIIQPSYYCKDSFLKDLSHKTCQITDVKIGHSL